MKGDFSRLPKVKDSKYSGVRLQQGRVILDADFNEQMDLVDQRLYELMDDIIGGTGTPRHVWVEGSGEAFKVTMLNDRPALKIAPGRYYVDGIPVTLQEETTIPGSEFKNILGGGSGTGTGSYLIYLEVWRQTVSSAEDGSWRETALGQADTSLRVETRWRIGAHTLPSNSSTVESVIDTFRNGAYPSLRVSSEGATNLSNQLYRVECHEIVNGKTTLKWSRDNGSEAVCISGGDKGFLTIVADRRHLSTWVQKGDVIELFSRADIDRHSTAGVLVTVSEVRETTIKFHGSDVSGGNYVLARLWNGCLQIENNSFGDASISYPIENGLRITFDKTGATKVLEPGHYWTFTTRAGVPDPTSPTPAPYGPERHYAGLAVVKASRRDDDYYFVPRSAIDHRRVFALATDETAVMKSGDQGMSGGLTVSGASGLKVIGGVGTFNAGLSVTNGSTQVNSLSASTLTVASNVVIGTSSGAQLDVNGTVRTIGNRQWTGRLNSTVADGTIGTYISTGGAFTHSGPTLSATKDYDGTFPAAALGVFNQVFGQKGTQFRFLSKTAGNDTSDGEVKTRMIIDAEGRVGIGTTSPEARLEVGGDMKVWGPTSLNDLSVTDIRTRSLCIAGAEKVTAFRVGVWTNSHFNLRAGTKSSIHVPAVSGVITLQGFDGTSAIACVTARRVHDSNGNDMGGMARATYKLELALDHLTCTVSISCKLYDYETPVSDVTLNFVVDYIVIGIA